MSFQPATGHAREVRGRIWRFVNFEFDESARELRSPAGVVDLEAKPLEVLYQLLLHAGEVVTKEELLDSVWPGVTVVEGSLATAVSKLRKAVGEEPPIVVTVPRMGYRLAVPVQSRQVAPPPSPELDFRPGDGVPGRDHWHFVRRLDSASAQVWLAEHPKTHEHRVFKFAPDGLSLKGLKREVTLARLLKDSLGQRVDFVRVLEWNFDQPPFYIESEFCGPNLGEWADAQGGLRAIPMSTRLNLMIELAQAVAAAHSVGILHKDLKPANVLMAPLDAGGFQLKVADFGSGALTEPGRLHDLGITNLGFTHTLGADAAALTGTLMYMPPEVLAGNAPTALADVYALGVILYQFIAGDFRKPLSPGWEAEIDDPLLREDIGDAACGDPARRLTSVAALVERLQTLEARRTERRELEQARERAQVAEQRLSVSRARRPWAIAAAVALVAGLAASLLLYGRARTERDRANRETKLVADVNRFLSDDLLGRSDPFQSGTSKESLSDAIKQAAPNIDHQFPDSPEVAARLHLAIARALDSRSEYADARRQYERAAALFVQAQGPLSQDAIAVNLQRASMEARTYQKGSADQARSLLAAQDNLIAKLPHPREDFTVFEASARGMIALIENDAKGAATQWKKAYDVASTLPEFDYHALLTLKQRLAFASIRLGDGAAAERLFRELIAAFSQADGPQSPNVLRVRLNLAQAYMIENKSREAVDEVNRIYPAYLARLGPDHELSMQLLTTRAQCEATLGLWDDAIRDDLAIYNLAVQKQGPTSFFAVATLADAALAQCRAGRLKEGEANARKVFDTSAKAFGPASALTQGIAYTVASCDVGLGNLAEASRLLNGIDPKPVEQLTGDRTWFANVALAQADVAYRQGNKDAARKYLQSAAPVFSKPDAEPYQKRALETLSAKLK